METMTFHIDDREWVCIPEEPIKVPTVSVTPSMPPEVREEYALHNRIASQVLDAIKKQTPLTLRELQGVFGVQGGEHPDGSLHRLGRVEAGEAELDRVATAITVASPGASPELGHRRHPLDLQYPLGRKINESADAFAYLQGYEKDDLLPADAKQPESTVELLGYKASGTSSSRSRCSL